MITIKLFLLNNEKSNEIQSKLPSPARIRASAFLIVQLQRLALLRQITFTLEVINTSACEEHLASRADRGASAFLMESVGIV
jgi:hypothetical protein